MPKRSVPYVIPCRSSGASKLKSLDSIPMIHLGKEPAAHFALISVFAASTLDSHPVSHLEVPSPHSLDG